MNNKLVFITSCASGEDGAITSFNMDSGTGKLAPVSRYTDIENPFIIALSPDRKRLYATQVPGDFERDPGAIAAFEIVGTSGELRKLNEQTAIGTTTCYVDIDPSGKAVVMANYSSGSVGSYPVQPDGSLGQMATFVQHEGASAVNPERQEGPHAHCSVISPNGQHMYACDLGLDQILGYSLDAATAQLTPLEKPYVRTLGGGGPRHCAFHPQAGYAYADNEMHGSVHVYRYDANTGTLIERQTISTLPDHYDGEASTADIKVTPDGRYFYCTNRIHNSIAIYRIGDDGCLTLVDISSSLGGTPQNLAITFDSELLLCANMDGAAGNVVVFRIDGATGKLRALAEPFGIHSPSCILVA